LLPVKSGEKQTGPTSGGFEHDQKQADDPEKAKVKGTENGNGVDRPHRSAMLNQAANELGATLRTPICAGFERVCFVQKTS
jgi:hypothetical protein